VPRVALPDGAFLHAEVRQGEGAPVVLLHGVLDSSRAWALVADKLHAAGRAVILLDARGHGASSPWSEGMDWSPRAESDDVLVALRDLAPEGAHLVGHSRGATSASWVAALEPALARSLAVVASPPQASEAFRAHFRSVQTSGPREREACAYLATIPDDAFPAEALRRYRGPALVVEPSDDPLYSPVGTMFWRAFLPFADFERPPGPHRFHASEPGASWLASRLLRFLEAADGR